MWILERPLYLLFLSLVPVGIYFRHFWKQRGGTITFSFSIWKGERFKETGKGIKFFFIFSFVLFWAGIVICIISLGGPAFYEQERIYLSRGIDIMIVLDESPSMAALDFKPANRFDSAKTVIRSFIAGREHDPIGLVSFGKEAALRVPPTLDYKEVLSRLDNLSLMDLGDGTAIGMGIAVACLHLKQSTAESKVIILLTDGEDNAGEIPPETSMEIAREMGIRIYTIGIGKKGEVPLEFTNPETGKTYKGVFLSGFDEDLLKMIAYGTGGEYFSALSQNSLDSIFSIIDAMETFGQKVKITTRTIPKHRVFIFWGFILILADFFIRKVLLREVLP